MPNFKDLGGLATCGLFVCLPVVVFGALPVLIPVIRRAKTGQSSAPKTGHRVGGIGWKNRLVRTCLQGA